jgi:iron(III) transport system permease protein
VEKGRGFPAARAAFQLLAMMPMAVPGLVPGLAYIFFFNHRANPLGVLYRTMAILVVNTIVHFSTVAHLTALTALEQMDPEFEAVSASLRQPSYRTSWRVTVPVCLPAVLDSGTYRPGRRRTNGGGRGGDEDLLHQRGGLGGPRRARLLARPPHTRAWCRR